MNTKMRYLFVAITLVSIVTISSGIVMAGEDKGTCDNPIKDTIEETASIKEMQSKPASALSFKHDVLGNRLPDQTENSGNIVR